jgi:N-acyl-L-homoserine lactone synthetase
MFFVEVVMPSARASKSAEVLEFMKIRKDVFVDEFKWDVPNIVGDYEIDQFDLPDTTYLLLLDAGRKVVGGSRLTKTSGRHMMQEVFADLCTEPVPMGDDCFEISRSCIAKDIRDSKAGGPLYALLMLTMLTHSKSIGVSKLIFVVDRASHDRLAKYFPVTPLGPETTYKGDVIIPAMICLDGIQESTIQNIIARGQLAAA